MRDQFDPYWSHPDGPVSHLTFQREKFTQLISASGVCVQPSNALFFFHVEKVDGEACASRGPKGRVLLQGYLLSAFVFQMILRTNAFVLEEEMRQ